MIIQVTQQHIDSGLKGSCTSDPIALALKDAGFPEPWVSAYYIQTDKGDKSTRVETPDSVDYFQRLFDNGSPVHPFEFELEEHAS